MTSADPASRDQKPAKPRKVVVALMSKVEEFQLLQASDAEASARRHGLGIEVFMAADAVEQIHQLYPVVHARGADRPAAIVIETGAGEGLERVAREALQAGIGWILMNRRVAYLQELRAKHPELPVASVSTDQLEIGRIQGRQLRALLPGGGSVLYIKGQPDTFPAQERLAGTREVLQGSSLDLRVYAGDWKEASGRKVVTSWLKPRGGSSDQVRAVAAQNDHMAVGAREAFLELRPDWADLPFLGCDGLPDSGQRLVDSGELAATVVNPSNSGRSLALLADWLETGTPPPAEVLVAPSSYPPMDALKPSPAWGRR